MFRKLASFLFKEEEIIIEEEELSFDSEDNYEIPKIKSIKAPVKEEGARKEEKVALNKREIKDIELTQKKLHPEDSVDQTIGTSKERPSDKVEKNQPKIQRINVDSPLRKEEKQSSYNPLSLQSEYRPKEVISPIYGGKEKENQVHDVRHQIPKRASRKSSIISPMYGVLNEEKEVIKEDVKDYNLSEMLVPESSEEVQVSLYDYLEELKDEE